ncbi:MAG: TIGR01548 family HAD-type hydrolase [Spirulina sp. SIO3F2]|nr:TIGR01548 family HAD-type hydrolase [Spirulina sp. SIO3F2]
MIFVFDIDGVIRDVSGSYRRALADTVEQFTAGQHRPTPADIDRLKAEGIWNNDWKGSEELTYRYWETQGRSRPEVTLDYETLVDFFQSRYRGANWDGYVATEPLLVHSDYFAQLTTDQIHWGFFSGATRASAEYVLCQRLGLVQPQLVAMEDAPDKPNPTGLFQVCAQLHSNWTKETIVYAGDTVADMHTIQQARSQRPELAIFGVGIIPPHAQQTPQQKADYSDLLTAAGASQVLTNIEQLTLAVGQTLN